MVRRLVVEADGGSRGNPGPAGYGAVVKDADTGEVLAEAASAIGTASNNVAEYRGLIAGLTAARTIDAGASVEARMDSKLVVEQMSGRWKIKHPAMRPLALEAAQILPRDQVTYVWVPRAQNGHADRLANEAMDAAAEGRAWARGAVAPAEPARRAGTAERDVPVIGSDRPADVGPPTTLHLLRHGVTVATEERRFSGSGGADLGLTEVGRSQAKDAAAEVVRRSGSVAAVVASPLRRCQETAAEVAAALGLDVRTDDGFAEAAFGEWDGLTIAEVAARWPDEMAAWWASPEVAPPGGEPLVSVGARVRMAQARLLARFAGRTVVVVSHVTPIKEMVRVALGVPVDAVYRMHLDPASLSSVAWWADGNSSLRGFNETTHLR